MDVWSQEIPEQIGRYKILDRIDIGGMAEVFLSLDRDDSGADRLLAIKRILPHIAQEDSLVSMFIDEWRITAKLTHANIARIYDFGRSNKLFFIAMEFINGVDLRAIQRRFNERREEEDPLLDKVAALLIADVCSALDYGYHKIDDMGQPMRIVHRDVSPSNVLIDFAGQLKLIDFGVAKATQRVYKTVGQDLKGKFAYMSPEQASGKHVDNRSDIFGVGILLYELLTGINPFLGDGDFDTLERIVSLQAAPPSAEGVNVPAALDDCCCKALSLAPDERFARASEMEQVLRAHCEAEGFGQMELSAWLQEVFPEEHAKANKIAARVKNPTSEWPAVGDRWDMQLDRDSQTTQRSAAGEHLTGPHQQPARRHTSWIAMAVAGVLVFFAAILVYHVLDATLLAGEPARSTPPAEASARRPAVRDDQPVAAPLPPQAADPAAPTPSPAAQLRTVMVAVNAPGATCRVLVGDSKVLSMPTPCRFDVPHGSQVQLRVSAAGFFPFSETWTVSAARRVKVALTRIAPLKVVAPPRTGQPRPPAPQPAPPPAPAPAVVEPADQPDLPQPAGLPPVPKLRPVKPFPEQPVQPAKAVPVPRPAPPKKAPPIKAAPKPPPPVKAAPKPAPPKPAPPKPTPPVKAAPKPAPPKPAAPKPEPPKKAPPKKVPPKKAPKLDDQAVDWE